MKTRTKMLAVGTTAAILAGTLGLSAFAGTPATGTGGGPFMSANGQAGMGPGMMGAVAGPTDRLAALKQQLGITKAEEPAWNTYAKVVQDTTASLRALHGLGMMSAMQGAMQGGNDAWTVMTQFHNQHWQAVQTLHAAATQLLASLDDAQQEKARTELPGLVFGGPAMMAQAGMMGMMGGTGMMGGMGMMGGTGMGGTGHEHGR